MYTRLKQEMKTLLLYVLMLFCFVCFQSFQVSALSDTTTVRIGLPNVPGMMYRDKLGNPAGFPIELVKSIAEQEGIVIKWIDGGWGDLFKMLREGEIDLLPGTQVTEERKKYLDYLDYSLYTMWSELYLPEGSHLNSIIQLHYQKIGLVHGDNNAKAFENYIQEYAIKYYPTYYSSHARSLEGLKKKEVFAIVGPVLSAKELVEHKLESSGLFFNPVDLNVGFRKGCNQELREQFNNRLKALKEDPNSIYYQLYDKYELSSFQEKRFKVPFHLVLLFAILFVAVAIAIVFIILLRSRVRVKTMEVESRNSFLRHAMKAGNMGAWTVDLIENKVRWSRELYNIIGAKYSNKEISFDALIETVHHEDRARVVGLFLESKENDSFEYKFRIKRKDGLTVPVKILGQVERDDNGIAIREYGILQNISEQKKYEEELINAKEKAEQSERLKSAFLANMSHEIRTPLNAIVGFSDLLTQPYVDNETRKEYVEIIHNQNDLLLSLINDVIDFAKIESGSLRVFPEKTAYSVLVKRLKELIESWRPQCPEHLLFIVDIPDFKFNFSCVYDTFRLEQIVNNLISNAFKYTPKGQVKVGLSVDKENRLLELSVEDTGIGISEADQAAIFDRFNQLDVLSPGAGLGLSITRSLAELMDCRLALQSELQKGSKFSLFMKIHELVEEEDSSQKVGMTELKL
ncbi:transporter substrate-binding domain-containing protein [Puteibacter caeruleilacunae]|nr:transporter substrate-binding domain-containing protein [Puteibacter caeruleilacunae]